MNWEIVIPQLILPIVIPNIVLIFSAYLHLVRQMNRMEDNHRGDIRGIEHKFEQIDQKIDQKYGHMEQKFDQKFERLDQKLDRLFEMLIIRNQLTRGSQLKNTKK